MDLPEQESFDSAFGTLEDRLDELDHYRAFNQKTPLAEPVRGARMTSRFGSRSDPFLGRKAFHSGLDLATHRGASVESSASGTVIRAGWAGGYGQMIEIDHGDGLVTRYGHLSKILVQKGQSVEQGDPIGAVGSTGRSTGPHLHYEIHENGKAIDPQRYLRLGRKLMAWL